MQIQIFFHHPVQYDQFSFSNLTLMQSKEPIQYILNFAQSRHTQFPKAIHSAMNHLCSPLDSGHVATKGRPWHAHTHSCFMRIFDRHNDF